jgi:hypothetical protein
MVDGCSGLEILGFEPSLQHNIQNPKPTSEEIQYVSDSLNMEKEVIRVWFCNR